MRADWIPEKLPEDPQSERSLLATLCAPGNEFQAGQCVPQLQDTDFVVPAHRAVFRALRALLARSEEVHSLTLKDELDGMKSLDRIGGYTGLVEILNGEDVGRPQALVDILRRKADLRRLIQIGSKCIRQATAEEGTPLEILGEVSTELTSMAAPRAGKGLRMIGDVGTAAVDRIHAIASGKARPGISTGLPKLDWMLGGGFKPGQLIVLAARPGVGKSTLLVDWERRAAENCCNVASFILEMTAEETWTRMASAEAGIDSQAIERGNLNPTEWGRIESARDYIQGLPMLVSDKASTTVPEMRAQIEHQIAKMGHIGLVGIDYLQLIQSPKGSQAARQNEAVRVGEISRQCKLMAKDLNVPVILLSQMNREIEKEKRRPQLSDLRDSGAIEQDADVVLFLHRGKADEDSSRAELIAAKVRNGPTGVVHLQLDMAHYRFHEETRETSQAAACEPRRLAVGE